jgi:hypothetical protein
MHSCSKPPGQKIVIGQVDWLWTEWELFLDARSLSFLPRLTAGPVIGWPLFWMAVNLVSTLDTALGNNESMIVCDDDGVSIPRCIYELAAAVVVNSYSHALEGNESIKAHASCQPEISICHI